MAEYLLAKRGEAPSGFVHKTMDEAIESLRYVETRWGPHSIYVRAFGQWLPVDEEEQW